MFMSRFTVREVTCDTSGQERYGLTAISVETKLLQYSDVTILSTFPNGLVNASLQIPPWTNSSHCVNPFHQNSRHAFQTKEDTSTSLANNRSKSLQMIFQFVSCWASNNDNWQGRGHALGFPCSPSAWYENKPVKERLKVWVCSCVHMKLQIKLPEQLQWP